jgi:hypothetical protein
MSRAVIRHVNNNEYIRNNKGINLWLSYLNIRFFNYRTPWLIITDTHLNVPVKIGIKRAI